TATEFRELRDVAVALVDRFQRILRRVEQEAGGQLFVVGAAVEQRGRGRQIIEVRHRAIQREGAGHVFAERAGDAQEELLRRFDGLARARVAQQVTVV